MLQRSIHLNYVCRTETQTVFQTVAYLCLSLASIFNIVCMTICLDRFTILSLPCIFNIGSGQMPQECERHQQVDQEGAAGDGGGEEQGGGQAASTGNRWNMRGQHRMIIWKSFLCNTYILLIYEHLTMRLKSRIETCDMSHPTFSWSNGH